MGSQLQGLLLQYESRKLKGGSVKLNLRTGTGLRAFFEFFRPLGPCESPRKISKFIHTSDFPQSKFLVGTGTGARMTNQGFPNFLGGGVVGA